VSPSSPTGGFGATGPPSPTNGFSATSWRFALLATLVLAAGCSKPAPPPAQEAAPAETPATSTGNATIVGHGPRPNPGAQIVVVLEPTTSRQFPPQTDVPVMDQVGLTFGPPLLLVRTGQPVEFRNSDDTLHNVHVTHEETREPAFNVAIPTDNSYTYTFQKDGFYRVGCDIHPAMAASVFSVSTPYVTLAEPDGRFTIADVTPGTYTATVYSGGRKLQRAVEAKSGIVEITVE
jgi:plastocyanin